MCGRACHCIHLAHLHEWDFSIPPLPKKVVLGWHISVLPSTDILNYYFFENSSALNTPIERIKFPILLVSIQRLTTGITEKEYS